MKAKTFRREYFQSSTFPLNDVWLRANFSIFIPASSVLLSQFLRGKPTYLSCSDGSGRPVRIRLISEHCTGLSAPDRYMGVFIFPSCNTKGSSARIHRDSVALVARGDLTLLCMRPLQAPRSRPQYIVDEETLLESLMLPMRPRIQSTAY